MNLSMWSMIDDTDAVKERLTELIKIQAMKVYLITYQNVYDSISIENLSNMFQFNKNKIHNIISKVSTYNFIFIFKNL